MGAQARHGPDPQERPDGERHERIPPAHPLHPERHQVDGDQRQREAERGLEREHGADQFGLRELDDRGRELRRIGDDGDAPDQAD